MLWFFSMAVKLALARAKSQLTAQREEVLALGWPSRKGKDDGHPVGKDATASMMRPGPRANR